MKTAGDILSALFDEGFVKKAKGYSKFFDSWEDLCAKNGIASASAHSRIKNLDRGLVLIEMDHSGWKQILQTKQSKLLNDFRIRFPELDISGISLMLSSCEPQQEEETKVETVEAQIERPAVVEQSRIIEELPKGLDAIEDENFKEMLKKLGETVAEREKNRYNSK